MLSNIVSVVIIVVAVLSIVTAINPSITGAFSLITAALGAGLGFGAQNIVKDVLNGLFMVVEDQLGVGDVVDTGLATGVVEGVGIRVTQIRDVNGTLWYVRNGEIMRVGNMSQGWARVIIDLAVPYDADVDAVQDRMLETANELVDSERWQSSVLEQPEIWGLESISAEALVIRLVMKTRTSAKDDVARELRMRLKRALDEHGRQAAVAQHRRALGLRGRRQRQGARSPKPIEPTTAAAKDRDPHASPADPVKTARPAAPRPPHRAIGPSDEPAPRPASARLDALCPSEPRPIAADCIPRHHPRRRRTRCAAGGRQLLRASRRPPDLREARPRVLRGVAPIPRCSRCTRRRTSRARSSG